jgi:hypothetical protein
MSLLGVATYRLQPLGSATSCRAGWPPAIAAPDDAGELVGVGVVQHHADPAQALGRLVGRLGAFVPGHQAVVMM